MASIHRIYFVFQDLCDLKIEDMDCQPSAIAPPFILEVGAVSWLGYYLRR